MKMGQTVQGTGSSTSLPLPGAARALAPTAAEADVSHNLHGQRLGKKGRETRDRIIAATQGLLACADGGPITLSAVAREVNLGLTSLYLYFTDLTELLLAVLDPVIDLAGEAYMARLGARWPDETLADSSQDFVQTYYRFWKEHSRLLHLRNAMADNHDQRMLTHRVETAQRMISLLVFQMDGDVENGAGSAMAMATVLTTGIERVVTMGTDILVTGPAVMSDETIRSRLQAVARLLELGIRENRDMARGGAPA